MIGLAALGALALAFALGVALGRAATPLTPEDPAGAALRRRADPGARKD